MSLLTVLQPHPEDRLHLRLHRARSVVLTAQEYAPPFLAYRAVVSPLSTSFHHASRSLLCRSCLPIQESPHGISAGNIELVRRFNPPLSSHFPF
jgi:hypothetical protein